MAPASTSVPVVPAPDAELPPPPFDPHVVEELMRNVSRATKTQQLYLPNNPIYLKAIEGLRASFAPVWRHTPELVLTITESDFKWEGRSVFHEANRGESLPWVFYKDGVRELTLAQGVEHEEIVALFEILQKVRKALPEHDDLLTLLWEEEFAYLRYRFVDLNFDAAAPIEVSETAAEPKQLPLVEIKREVEETPPEPEARKRAGLVSMEDLNATLYFLDEAEIEYLRGALDAENHLDLRKDVIAMLLDIFEVQADPKVREEALASLQSLLLHLLQAGAYGAVSYLLREAEVAAQRAPSLAPEMAARLRQLPDQLSDPAVLPQLLQALDDADVVPPQEELDTLFGQLKQGTLSTVLSWLKQAQNPRIREALERTAARLASANVSEMLKLIASDDPSVALEAIRRAGELKATAAVPQLAKIMQSLAPELRQAASAALAEIASPGALRLLETALGDGDRDVRVTAVRALAARGYRTALPKLEAVVNGKALKDADLTEKREYFEAYGALAGPGAVSSLDRMLNSRGGLFRRRLNPDLRACAAHALGRIGNDAALAALRRAEGDTDVRVRSAINRALRGGGA
ncbi:MAG TPA: HEAT repeat domain-containing protein [Gemmatimonadaceae bacterium]|nr:HEAT repeat domain-containing protein [Gemmatimonadaceae bacterium]